MSKPRSDSKLLNLPDEQQCQIADWLLGGMPYHVVGPLIEKEYGVKVSKNVLMRFWQTVCEPMLLVKRRRAVQTSEAIADEAKARPGQFNAAAIDALQQKAFELMISPQADARDVHDLFSLVLKAQAQEMDKSQLALDERRIKLLEERASQAELAREVVESDETPEQQQAKLKQIFGM